MKKSIKYLPMLLAIFSLSIGYFTSEACTSMIVGAKASKNGKPMLWKHRDTGTEHNFIEKVEAPDYFSYVALYNGGDSLLREAWMGVNSQGFAIMNTASYNLAPDTALYKDREGEVMTRALQICKTVDDFKILLDTLPKPLGVQANFGVIDALGNGAYFETDDYKYTPFYLSDSPGDIMVRTNYSFSGNDTDGFGYIRYDNAIYLLEKEKDVSLLTPEFFTEQASKSFYNSRIAHDYENDSVRWVVDQDFIPRFSSSASVVIEGVAEGENPSGCVMWAVIGYPPCSSVLKATVSDVPDELRPLEAGFRSKVCNQAIEKKGKAFPIRRGSGKHYIDMHYLRPVIKKMREKSASVYKGTDY